MWLRNSHCRVGSLFHTDQITAAPAGSKLIVTVKYDPDSEGGTKSGTADAGWGIGGIGTAGWDVDADFGATCADKPSFGDELTFTYDVDAIKAAATGDITVNFYNGFLVTKIVLQTPDAPKTEDPKTEDPKDDTPKTADTMTVAPSLRPSTIIFMAVAGVFRSCEMLLSQAFLLLALD